MVVPCIFDYLNSIFEEGNQVVKKKHKILYDELFFLLLMSRILLRLLKLRYPPKSNRHIIERSFLITFKEDVTALIVWTEHRHFLMVTSSGHSIILVWCANPEFQFHSLKEPWRNGVYTVYFDRGNAVVRHLDVFVLIEIFTQITLNTKNQGCRSL